MERGVPKTLGGTTSKSNKDASSGSSAATTQRCRRRTIRPPGTVSVVLTTANGSATGSVSGVIQSVLQSARCQHVAALIYRKDGSGRVRFGREFVRHIGPTGTTLVTRRGRSKRGRHIAVCVGFGPNENRPVRPDRCSRGRGSHESSDCPIGTKPASRLFSRV